MVDPLSLAAGAVIGAATGKFTEKAWDSGEAWIKKQFQGHDAKSQQTAKENASAFMLDLALRISKLEQEGSRTAAQITAAQENPAFSSSLQRAIILASRTAHEPKHQILSRIISERIGSSENSALALTTDPACDAVSHLSSQQMLILGLMVNVLFIRPDRNVTPEQLVAFLQPRLKPFSHITPTLFDYSHLEALSCTRHTAPFHHDLREVLNRKHVQDFELQYLQETDFGAEFINNWENHDLKYVAVTSVGRLIGVVVSDEVTGIHTDISDW